MTVTLSASLPNSVDVPVFIGNFLNQITINAHETVGRLPVRSYAASTDDHTVVVSLPTFILGNFPLTIGHPNSVTVKVINTDGDETDEPTTDNGGGSSGGGTTTTGGGTTTTGGGTDATLRGLVLVRPEGRGEDAAADTLDFDFRWTQLTYAVAVAHSVDTLTVTPTVSDYRATVKVNGQTVPSGQPSDPIALKVGQTRIAVEITARNGFTKTTYTLTVTRPAGESADEESAGEEQPVSAPPPPSVLLDGIAVSPDAVREDDGQATTITVTVTLDQAAGFGGEKITLALVAPTRGKTAKQDEDFTATLSDTLTIAQGRIKGTAALILTPKDNATADGDKALAVQATSSSGHRVLINIKIIDDEQADEPADSPAADEAADEPAFAFAGPVAAQAYTAGSAITPLVLPEATGGQGAVTYSIFGLPAGLSFDASTRTISGTPEAATDGAVEVSYMAQDSTGAIEVMIFAITVNPPLSFGDLFN